MFVLKAEEVLESRIKYFSDLISKNKNEWKKFKIWERKNHIDLDVPNFNEIPNEVFLRKEDIPNPNIIMRCINYDYFENRGY